jgi:hypothetical protein
MRFFHFFRYDLLSSFALFSQRGAVQDNAVHT